MNRVKIFILLALSAVSLPLLAEEKPNIILFMVDDMGWTDCGAYGSQYYETPNVDRFATQAMRFTQAYAHPLCSPSRASIMTGQEESRHGIMSAHGHLEPEPWAPQVFQENPPDNQPFLLPKSRRYLDPKAVTLAEALKQAGYRTAHLGKWHLGLTQPHWPEAHGFETTFHAAPDPGPPGSTYFSPHEVHPDGHPSSGHRVGNITDGPAGEHIDDRLAQEAIKFITKHQDEPFYLNLWMYDVHGPWEAKEDYIKAFAEKKDPGHRHGNPVYAAMLKTMDDNLGKVMKTLDDLKLADNTIIVFYSDNGGNTHSMGEGEQKKVLKNPKHRFYPRTKVYNQYAGFHYPTNNEPLREGKGHLYEGGERVPLMVRWPDKIPAGTTSDAIINNIDLYPTLLDLVEVPLPENHIVDGLSFAPVLLEGAELPRDTSFSWFPYNAGPGISVRKGDWKLIRRFKENTKYYEGLVELYNLKEDLGEQNNLAKQIPEKVAELGKLIDQHFAQTGGLYPKPNPAYNDKTASNAAKQRGATYGLVPKQCKIEQIKGAIRVLPQGKQPFLGTAQVRLGGALSLRLRARGVSGEGGTGRIQWRSEGQDDFPQNSQTVSFELAPGKDWQEVEIAVPSKGKSTLVRIHLPGAKALEIQSIQWGAEGQKGVAWDFSDLVPK